MNGSLRYYIYTSAGQNMPIVFEDDDKIIPLGAVPYYNYYLYEQFKASAAK